MEDEMFVHTRRIIVLLLSLLGFTGTTYAGESCRGAEPHADCVRLTQCINQSLNFALRGDTAATDVLNIDLLRQRALGQQGRTLAETQAARINTAYIQLINDRFTSNRNRFANADLTVTFFNLRRTTYVVNGMINRNGSPYRYTALTYFTSSTSCRFYDITIEGIFGLGSWLRNHNSLKALYREYGIQN